MALVEAAVAVTDQPKSYRLAVLTAAALALPGISSADLLPQAGGVESNFTRYSESGNRMRVDAYQATGNLVVNDSLSFKVNGVKDVVTGASPVLLTPRISGYTGGPSNKAYSMIMSSASIHDVRDSVDLSASYVMDKVTMNVDVGRSSENDYVSNFFNVDGRWELNGKRTTLATGYGYASDHVWEIVKLADGSKGKASGVGGDKESHQTMLGVTQILDKNSLLQANLTYNYSAGYLSDPYKYVYANWAYDPQYGYGYLRDSRPGSRNQMGLLLRYVRNFSGLNSAALHMDYRFYADTWGIDSHTFEASWIQPVWYGWQITPRIRYYTQNAADFYQPVFVAQRIDNHYSSDYRLAGFGAIGGGVQVGKEFFGRLRVSGGVDFYKRQKGYGLSGGAGTSLDNFSFSLFSVSLNLKF